MRLYWRGDQDQWVEFTPTGTTPVGPVDAAGHVYALSDWQYWRQTGYRQSTDPAYRLFACGGMLVRGRLVCERDGAWVTGLGVLDRREWRMLDGA